MNNGDVQLNTHDPPRTAGKRIRVEVQALRAVALILILVYHVDSRLMPGGYVWLDVFFVISGFLITPPIAASLQSSRGFSLTNFYMRRVRRLLPAALTVLCVVGLVTLTCLPVTMWNPIGRQIIASVCYVQNWLLAFSSLNYLAGAAASSPLEHFWSLAVEEQFYLVWPILLVLAAWWGKRIGQVQRSLVISIATVVLVSFAYSAVTTSLNPTWAYYITPTRMWELGLGGLLGMTVPELSKVPDGARIALSWAGYAGMFVSAWLFSAATMFPGYVAALPALSAALVIAAGDVPGRFSNSRLAHLRPIQFIGDISYSIYLWHWPFVVITPIVLFGPGSTLPAIYRPLPVIASIFVAWLSKKWIEDPFRRQKSAGSTMPLAGIRTRTVLATSAALAIVALALGSAIYVISEIKINKAEAELSAFVHGPQQCVGAAGLAQDCVGRSPTGIHPDPIIAAQDIVDDGCLQEYQQTSVIQCEYGVSDGIRKTVAVVGDSHAQQWLPAIRRLAEEQGWQVTTYVKGACPYADGIGFATCRAFNANVKAILDRNPPDIVFTSARSALGYGSDATKSEAVAGFVSAWHDLIDHGSRVIAIADTPAPYNAGIFDPSSAVATGDLFTYSLASGASSGDAIPEAARSTGATLVDMTAGICVAGQCPSVIGGVLVYGDSNHLTATYSRTLAAMLGRAIDHATA